MNALRWITKEAKALRRRYPKRFAAWKQYVAQASAIYAAKHKGKSPVGRKRRVGSVRRRRKVSPATRSKTVRRIRKLHAAEGKAIRSLGSVSATKTHLKNQLKEKIAWNLLAVKQAKTKRAKKKIAKVVSADMRTLRSIG